MNLHCGLPTGTPRQGCSACPSFKTLRFLFFLLLLAAFSTAAIRMILPNSSNARAQEKAASYVSQLVYGTPSRRTLGQNGHDVYFVDLPAGFFIKILAEQNGVDVTLKLFAPGGNAPIEEADSPTDTEGIESFAHVTDQAGKYRIEVHSLEQQGEYEIKIAELHLAGDHERARARADSLHRKAVNEPSPQLQIKLEEEAVAVLERLSPQPVAELADSILHLGQLYRESSDQQKAEKHLERAMALLEQVFGKESTKFASVLDELGIVVLAQGKVDEAEKLFRHCIGIREKVAPDSAEIALTWKNVANVYKERGNYTEAQRLYRQSLDALETKLGPEHVDLTYVLVPFGELCRITADYIRAEQYFKRSLALYKKSPFVGPEHPNIALLLDKMAALYIQTGDFKSADDCIQSLQKLLRLFETKSSPDNLDIVTANSNVGKLHFDRGQYAEAEKVYQDALQIRKRKLGDEHPLVASSLNNLAALYSERDQFVEAEDYYQKALVIRQKAASDRDVPETAEVKNNLGVLYNKKGDYLEAEQCHKEALKIREQAFGSDHPAVATSLNNLAAVLINKAAAERLAQRDSASESEAKSHKQNVLAIESEAEGHLKRALNIQETKLNPEHPAVSLTLTRLANLYSRHLLYKEAKEAYERALKINRKHFGEGHPFAGRILNELANLYRDQGLLKQAESNYEQALKIQEHVVGGGPFYLIKLLGDYARCYQRAGNTDRAGSLLGRSLDLIESSISRNLGAGSERQRLAYLATFRSSLDQILELDEQQAGAKGRFGNLAFLALLRLKGRGLDEMVDRLSRLRSQATPGERMPLEKLLSVRSELSALTWREFDPTSHATDKSLREKRIGLEKEMEKAEAEFGKVSSLLHHINLEPATIEAVQKILAGLADETALVEFAVHDKEVVGPEGKSARRYAAYVITKSGEPKRIDLGDAATIEHLVNALRPALGQRNSRETIVRDIARQLDKLVLQPVRAKLGDETRRLLISPDGELNLIPFAALVDERSQYLVERYSITYLTSGRDLMRLQTPRPSRTQPLIVGNPAFGKVAGVNTTLAANTRRASARGQACDLSKLSFGPLPETKPEMEKIEKLLPGAKILSSENATTAALRAVSGPGILHLATHGFFLCPGEIKNPLLRSGLAMAGFNQYKSGSSNGALMALEVASLDLDGTKLVVLSACETGLGEVKIGEGVYGLRRALVMAGSESQMMSLWKVSSYYTQRLMIDYYAGLLGPDKQGRGEALRQVQLKMLENKNLRHPYFWAGFIQSGEWANLEGER